jgi:hypothetical protein
MITEIELNENSLKYKDKGGMDQGLIVIIYLQSYCYENCSNAARKYDIFLLIVL